MICRFETVRGVGDAEIARLAELQHGHIHLEQLRSARIGDHARAWRVRTGRLHATLPSVFLVGRPHTDALGRAMAAALYAKGDGMVAGRYAADIWGMLDTTQRPGALDPVEVMLVGRNGARPAGVRIRRATSVAAQDVRRRDGIPVTSPARTILDLAAAMDQFELEAVLFTALRRNLVRRSQLADVIARHPKAKGIAQLRALLEQTEPLRDTRSRYERKFLSLMRSAELPLPSGNTWIAGKYVDGVWPEIKLALEIDGFGHHGGRGKFESDRVRDQQLMIADHNVMRVTARQIDQRPRALIARTASIITALQLRAAGGR